MARLKSGRLPDGMIITVALICCMGHGITGAIVKRGAPRSTCPDGLYMNDANLCVEQCEPGLYGDDRTGTCEVCDDSCRTCTTAPSTCTSCNEPFYLLGNECSSSCGGQYPRGPARTSVRLVGGNTPFEGRVEILHEGQWGTICDDGWSKEDADVVCRELQLGVALEACNAVQSGFNLTAKSPIHLDDVKCSGRETMLTFCQHSGWGNHNCGHFEDAGVRCSGPDQQRICVTNCGSGYFLDDQSQSCELCDAVCHECTSAADQCTSCEAPRFFKEGDCVLNCGVGFYGNTITQTCEPCSAECWNCMDGVLDNVCTSCREEKFFSNGACVESCDSSLYSKPLAIRLVGGNNIYEGRVEVYVNNEWGTVCDDTWDIHDAEVVCQELGYGHALNAMHESAFGPGSGSIWIDRIDCNGTEKELSHCPQAPFGDNVCMHYEDAAVVCSGEKSIALPWGQVLTPPSDMGATGKCVTDCGVGYYLDGTECRMCSAQCRSCSGTPDSCTACKTSHFLQDSTCVYECGNHKYGNTQTGQCEECDNSCQACAYSEVNNICTSCFRGFFLMGEVCSSVCSTGTFKLNGECVTDCGPGLFGNPLSSNCESCSSQGTFENCRTCELDIHSMLQCTSCYIPQILEEGRCVDECTNGLLAIPMNLDNVMGDLEIRLADGRNHLEGRIEVLYDGVWGTVCGDFFRKEAANLVCSEMGFGTAESFFTTGPETGVDHGSGQIWLDNVLCFGFEDSIRTCSHHQWGDHNCEHDQDIAVRCSGPGIQECVADCPDGYYRNTEDGTCELCRGGCIQCSSNPSYTCSRCKNGMHLLGVDCVDDCGHGFHTDESSVCQPCSGSCETCEGSSTHCTSCQILLYLNDGACVAECPELKLFPSQTLRIVGGTSPLEGRVELYHDGAWGTICDDQWSQADANVVCAALGFGVAVEAKTEASFGEGSGSILLDNIDCVGNETSLVYCSHDGLGVNDCDHSEDAGVVCSGPTTSNVCMTRASCTGNYFLTDDGTSCSKCDEACAECASSASTCLSCKAGYFLTSENKCEPKCPPHSYPDGENICRQCSDSCLECSDGPDLCTRCQAPDRLDVSTKSCVSSCTTGYVSRFRGDVRLRGGANALEGRVELLHNGQWGTVCDDSWNLEDAKVVCHQLGLGDAIEAVTRGGFGTGEGPIWLDEVECLGSEIHLKDCRRDTEGIGHHDCQHSEDAGVRCSGPDSSLQCVQDCGDGFYADSSMVCRECSLLCKDCSGSPDRCTSCPSSQFLKGNRCVDYCDNGFYGNTESGRCEACEGNCIECYDGVSGSQCKTCQDGFYLEGLSCIAQCSAPLHPVSDIIQSFGTSSQTVRLYGGSNEMEGIVQVFHNGVWGGVCNTNWDMADAEVVCRELGFGSAITILYAGDFEAVSPDVPIHLDRVQCRRFENYLTQCPSDGWGNHQCDPNHLQDAAIRCRPPSSHSDQPQEDKLCRQTNDDICREATCFPNVVCKNVGNSGSVCMACPQGQYGDGKNCTVVATELPKFQDGYLPVNRTVIAGEPNTFYCHGQGDPAPGVTIDNWQKDGKPLNPDDILSGRIGVYTYGSLYFKQTRTEDRGTYTCTLRNSQGSSSVSALLTVEEPPKILRTLHGEGAVSGKARLGCYVVGFPAPVIQWEKDGVILSGNKYQMKEGNHILEVNDLGEDDAGDYACHASNKLGNFYATVSLTVNEPPTFVEAPKSTEVEEGATVKVPCAVTGKPIPKVVWKKNGSPVSFEESRYFQDGTSLTIFKAQTSDMGSYACIAINSVQTVSRFADVYVIGPPHIMEGPQNSTYFSGETALFLCKVMGSPTPAISWEKDGEKMTATKNIRIEDDALRLIDVHPADEGEYVCVARNDEGTVRRSAFLSVNGPLHYGKPKNVGLVYIVLPVFFLVVVAVVIIVFVCRRHGKMSKKVTMPGLKKGKQGLSFTPIYTGNSGSSYVKFDKPEKTNSSPKKTVQRDSMTESILKENEEDDCDDGPV